jgi:epoxide hydrolase-like predicted phosphatase
MIRAVVFDVGGVLITSPVDVIWQYEQELKLPKRSLGSVFINGAPDNAFCRMERGEIKLSQFCDEFRKECEDLIKDVYERGLPLEFSVRELFSRIRKRTRIVPEMIDAIRQLKTKGYKVGIVTNNWADDIDGTTTTGLEMIMDLVDVVIQSCKVGMRKPDVRIYQLACDELGVSPSEVNIIISLAMIVMIV